MTPCSSCGLHTRAGDATCPHCGARAVVRPSRTAAAVLLGLSLAVGGCGGDDEKTDADQHSAPQTLYGVTTTDDTGPQ